MSNDLEKVKQNVFVFAYVKEQTPEICLAAVKQNVLVRSPLITNEGRKT